MPRPKINARARQLLLDIYNGTDRVFYMTDQPCGWTQLEKHGLARRHTTDSTRAVITDTGAILAEEIMPDHECVSTTTPDGHGAYCAICGDTLA